MSLLTRAKMIVPSSVAPDNQYAKAFAATLCLAVSADFKFDMEEFTQASIFIESDPFLRERVLTKRTVEFFKAYCDDIKKVMKEDNIDFPALQTEMIAEVREVPSEYVGSIRELIRKLIPVCEPQEKAVLERINL